MTRWRIRLIANGGANASLLERDQKENEYWESEDGPGRNVHSTLEAIRALALCGRVVQNRPRHNMDNTSRLALVD